MSDAEAKQTKQEIAAGYERLAQRVEQQTREAEKTLAGLRPGGGPAPVRATWTACANAHGGEGNLWWYPTYFPAFDMPRGGSSATKAY